MPLGDTPWLREALATLPAGAVMSDLDQALARSPAAVLQAPPGAGKTTLVPLALAGASWLQEGRILVLEPRRLAARMAARRMADLLGERVGGTVGYAVRLEQCIGPQTRIEVLTEGVLTGRLQRDPALEGVGLVIFDEFHERHLESDLGLALCREVQEVLNPRLRLLVMSATLAAEAVSALLDHAPVIRIRGRRFPVETRHLAAPPNLPLEEAVARAVGRAARAHEGGILVFLPGAAEIRRAMARIDGRALGAEWILAPLHGLLSPAAQDLAVAAPPAGRRKIVLATAIAETSLTIEGIQVVVDSGVARHARFDPASGLTRLVTVAVTRDTADQRRGRAGRLGPGICYRLWSAHQDAGLLESRRPEMLEADLTGLALELACWGTRDPRVLSWLDPPPEVPFEAARRLLVHLGALEAAGRATAHGRAMARLGIHPRLAHMLLCARDQNQGWAACLLAAVLSERDPLRSAPGAGSVDIRDRVELAAQGRDATGDRLRRLAQRLARRLKVGMDGNRHWPLGPLLAWAYPDRIARRRDGSRGRFLLSNGREAFCDSRDPLAGSDYLAVAELDGQRRQARIFLAAVYDRGSLTDQFGGQLEKVDTVAWDEARRIVAAQCETRFGALVVHREPGCRPDPVQTAVLLCQVIRRLGIQCLPWTDALGEWRRRVALVRRLLPDDAWPDLGDEALAVGLEQWLGPFLAGIRSPGQVNLEAALKATLDGRRQKLLDRLAPTHLVVPSGARLPLDYGAEVPVLAARVQQMFGCTRTPVIVDGRQAVQVHLLSPAGRPVQITQDLAGFWSSGYPEVRKVLRGRYPRHPWPEDPLTAPPTNRAKKQRGRSPASQI